MHIQYQEGQELFLPTQILELTKTKHTPIRGRVQTTWTEFWVILNPLPLCGHFYLIAVIKCCVI